MQKYIIPEGSVQPEAPLPPGKLEYIEPKAVCGEIFKSINNVSKSVEAVKMVTVLRYKARRVYDVYNMLQPILAKEGVFITRRLIKESEKEVKSAKGNKGLHRYQLWEFKLSAIDGSSVTTEFPAESIDWGDKAASQCDAMAFKQLLIHTFMIPTEELKSNGNNTSYLYG